MKIKLTLSVDRDIIAAARKQAREQGVSVSSMFANFVEKKAYKNSSSLTTNDVVGSLKGLNIDDSKMAIHNQYARKYFY